MGTQYLLIDGLSCAGCVNTVEKALVGVDGVNEARVNFAEQTATILGHAEASVLIQAVVDAGYQARVLDVTASISNTDNSKLIILYKRALAAAIAGALLFFGSHLNWFPALVGAEAEQISLFWLLTGIISLLVIIYSGHAYYRGAWHVLLRGQANMNTLVAIGTGAAWLFSFVITIFPELIPKSTQYVYYESALIILAFINFGSALEARAKQKTSEALNRLIKLQAKTARVIRDDVEMSIPIAEVVSGDVLIIKPGEHLAVDGEVVKGESSVDESMISGEPIPVDKQVGDQVIAGTINMHGVLYYRAVRIGEQTVLSQIIDLVRQAQSSKPKIAKLVDKVASVFVPIVLLVAIATFCFWYFSIDAGFIESSYAPISLALVTSITVLIIACPCALGLATPISLTVGIGKAAEMGILIRNSDALQQSSKIDTVVLDKTGTITEGHPDVTSVWMADDTDEKMLWSLIHSVESNSEHPISQALSNKAKEHTVTNLDVSEFKAMSGFGVRALCKTENNNNESKVVYIGNRKMMAEHQIDCSAYDKFLENNVNAADTASLQTEVYVAYEGVLLAQLGLSDKIKVDSRYAVTQLKKLGINVVMITGDREDVAQHVADKVGIEQVIASALPEDKLAFVKQQQKQGNIVAVVGDGINDSPALAQADVGYAISSGTEVAIENADVTLMRNSILGVVNAIHISRMTVRNIKQNLFGAFIYNSIGIPMAAGVFYPFFGLLLSPMIAGAAMAMSSLTVVSNANRLRWIRSISV